MYPAALDCGIDPERFWNLTIPEISDLMESYERRSAAKVKQDLLSKHFLAKDISQFVALLVHGNDQIKIQELWDFFPELFGDMKEDSERKKAEQQLAVYKAQMLNYVNRYNNRKRRT